MRVCVSYYLRVVVAQEAEALAHPSRKELGQLSPKSRKEPGRPAGGSGGRLIPPLGGNPGNQAQTVEQELYIVKTRYLSAPKRGGSPSRLRPETRGWTPVSRLQYVTAVDECPHRQDLKCKCCISQTDSTSVVWRSPTATPSPSRAATDGVGSDRPHSVDFVGLPSLATAGGSASPKSVSDASTSADADGTDMRQYTNAEHTATRMWS